MKIFFSILIYTTVFSAFSQKINGFNFVAEKTVVSDSGFNDLIKINATWVAWTPYAFCNIKTGELKQNPEWQWKGETIDGCAHAVKLAHSKNLKVMMKPHVWLSNHGFTGTMSLSKDSWKKWEKDYSTYILTFAKLAEKYKVELFCVGTEQYSAINNDPKYWNNLIKKVREIYSGKITYAANWDTYSKCTFWNKVDYIGIDAYFPISELASPTISDLQLGWQKWKLGFKMLYRKHKKPILFTEFGYRSTEFNTKEPWKAITDEKYSETCQANAFQAIFDTFWKENWFAGGFIWKWYEPNKSEKYEHRKSFTTKGKSVEKIISTHFKLS